MSSSSSQQQLCWSPETDLLQTDPTNLITSSPRLAKDIPYAKTIQNVWIESSTSQKTDSDRKSMGSPLLYTCTEPNGTKTTLHGHIICPSNFAQQKTPLPVILFFHTGAGPHDIFLRWMADRFIANENLNTIVFITDLLSDDMGWGWNDDRSQYNSVMQYVLSCDDQGIRDHLRRRIIAAIDTLKHLPNADTNKMAALGWCLGGKSILELARMNLPEMKALASFHGVFDVLSSSLSETPTTTTSSSSSPRILICHGNKDPYLSFDQIQRLQTELNHLVGSSQWNMLQFESAKHAFTNPAQCHNPNPNFDYDEEAANASYKSVVTMLKETLFKK